MVSHRFGDRLDHVSGKAKEWAGRAAGNARLQRQGQLQSGLASAKITVRNTAKKLTTRFQEWRRR